MSDDRFAASALRASESAARLRTLPAGDWRDKIAGRAAELAAELQAIPGGWRAGYVGLAELCRPDGLIRGMTHLYHLLIPADPDAVLEADAAAGTDPYWAMRWPACEELARVCQPPWRFDAARVLELGCGCGLAGIAAAWGDRRVTLTDGDPRAVALAKANAQLNGREVDAHVLDWRDPQRGEYDAVIGADLLYQPDLHAPLLATLASVLTDDGKALLADPGRQAARAFVRAAGEAGWWVGIQSPIGHTKFAPQLGRHQLLTLARNPPESDGA